MTMLNSESLRFAAQLERESGAEQSVSVKEAAKFGAQLNAAKAKAAAPSVWARTKSLFGWLEGNAGKVVAKGVKTASALGLTVPLDKDITRLTNMKRELSSLGFQMQEIISKVVPRFLAKHSAATDMTARTLQTAASQAKAQLTAATKALDSAQASAQEAKRLIASGKLPGQVTAIFLVKKKQADDQYGAAKRRAEGVRLQWQNAESQLVKADTPKVSDYLRTAGSVVSEGGARAGAVAQWAGEQTEAAATAIKEGAPTAQALLKYWPWLAVGAGVLYLGVSAKASGAGLGRAFESVGETVGSYRRKNRRSRRK